MCYCVKYMKYLLLGLFFLVYSQLNASDLFKSSGFKLIDSKDDVLIISYDVPLDGFDTTYIYLENEKIKTLKPVIHNSEESGFPGNPLRFYSEVNITVPGNDDFELLSYRIESEKIIEQWMTPMLNYSSHFMPML